MNIKHQINLKAENSPYWTRIYEVDGKVFSEDIFSVGKKDEPTKHPDWESAIIKAMEQLSFWKGKINGFKGYITMDDSGWPDSSISLHGLYANNSLESEYLHKMLSGENHFDTGLAVMCENGYSLRILRIENMLEIQVSKEIQDVTEFVKSTLTTEEDLWMENGVVELCCQELQQNPEFLTTVCAGATISSSAAYADIIDRITMLIMEVSGKLEDLRRMARSSVLNMDQGTPMEYAVVVTIANAGQRGYYISARNTRELMDKLQCRTEIGHCASITYALVLSDKDIMLE